MREERFSLQPHTGTILKDYPALKLLLVKLSKYTTQMSGQGPCRLFISSAHCFLPTLHPDEVDLDRANSDFEKECYFNSSFDVSLYGTPAAFQFY